MKPADHSNVLSQLRHNFNTGKIFEYHPASDNEKVRISAHSLELVRKCAGICIASNHTPNCSVGGDGTVSHADIISLSRIEYKDLISKLEQVQQSASTPTP